MQNSLNVTHKKHNLYIHTQNVTKFGSKSLRDFGAHIWNTLPEYIKSTTSLKFGKTWPGPKCKYNLCKWEWDFLLNMVLVMHNILQRCIQSPVKHLRWSFLRKQLMTYSRWTLLSQEGPPWVFDRLLSTPLVSLSYTYEKGRVLGVNPLCKNGFKFSVYFFLIF